MNIETSPYRLDQKDIPKRQKPTKGGQTEKSKRYPYENTRKLYV